MPISSLLLASALCSSGVIYASDVAAVSKVDISQQQRGIKGTVTDATGPVCWSVCNCKRNDQRYGNRPGW